MKLSTQTVAMMSARQLLGDWNWYLPRWLDWLPRLQVEQPRPGGHPRAAFE